MNKVLDNFVFPFLFLFPFYFSEIFSYCSVPSSLCSATQSYQCSPRKLSMVVGGVSAWLASRSTPGVVEHTSGCVCWVLEVWPWRLCLVSGRFLSSFSLWPPRTMQLCFAYPPANDACTLEPDYCAGFSETMSYMKIFLLYVVSVGCSVSQRQSQESWVIWEVCSWLKSLHWLLFLPGRPFSQVPRWLVTSFKSLVLCHLFNDCNPLPILVLLVSLLWSIFLFFHTINYLLIYYTLSMVCYLFSPC